LSVFRQFRCAFLVARQNFDFDVSAEKVRIPS
jgi:hypothetical protein